VAIEEELQVLETKLKQLRLDYEQYFLGSRPREPVQARGEVSKLFHLYNNTAIPNTAARFKFNSLCSRFFAYRRQWDEVLRKIEEGSYTRHVFKANLHDRERGKKPLTPAAAPAEEVAPAPDVFESYREACMSTGQDVSRLTRAGMDAILRKQEQEIRQRFGCSEVRFRVVVEGGKARLKATPVGGKSPAS
jgi:hypothetical protein